MGAVSSDARCVQFMATVLALGRVGPKRRGFGGLIMVVPLPSSIVDLAAKAHGWAVATAKVFDEAAAQHGDL